jgi:PHP family Zn ribbon phosphoesterase
MSRVEKLASFEIEIEAEMDRNGVRWIKDRKGKRKPYVMMVPLMEIIAESFGVGVATKAVQSTYEKMISELGNEFKILFETGFQDINKNVGSKIAEAVKRVRAGDIFIAPGYDGVFGEVKIWKDERDVEIGGLSGQDTLF